jgi:hypothetical protein
MNIQNSMKTIDKTVEISSKNVEFIPNSDEPSKSFGIGESNVSFVGYQNVATYQKNLEELYKVDKSIYNTITSKTFEKSFINLIRLLRNEKRKTKKEDVQNLIAELKKIEIIESEVLYELYGCKMVKDKIQLGDFTVYNYLKSSDLLEQKYPYLENKELFFDRRNSDIFLSVKVQARENPKATEIADEIVKVFENVFSYMISDFKHQRSVGVFNYRKWNNTSRIICNNSNLGFSGTKDIVYLVDIDDDFFIDNEQGNNKIWSLITKDNKNEIERRLLQAIEWIGKGVYDKDNSKSLVQLVFAIEGMLQFNEKAIITPSIVSQISDWLAFIIQDNPTKRKEIVKFFKQTYRKRSAIVHGGSKVVDLDDLQIAFQIAKLMVISFLVNKPFCELQTMLQLNEYINDLKFS